LSKIKLILFVVSFVFLSAFPGYTGNGPSIDVVESDTPNQTQFGFFDLRDRETFIQVTNFDPNNNNIHIQIFDVSNNCNENNFFDLYTPNDTHVYNLRDIQTNDGNDSGVILPDEAYGVFVAYGGDDPDQDMIGNLRILDNNGYEYRTNLIGTKNDQAVEFLGEFATFNFSTIAGVTLSDIVLINVDEEDADQVAPLADILNVWTTYDVDIVDVNENIFSCRKIIFSCINQDSILYEALLEVAANETGNDCNGGDCAASVADIEYGINEAIPHSKGGELLCPGNNISEGIVRFEHIGQGEDSNNEAVVFVGLNNGNGRGSFDVFFGQNSEIPTGSPG